MLAFYPSSIKASKDLDKTMGVGPLPNALQKHDLTMDEADSEQVRLSRFKDVCRQQLDIGKLFSDWNFGLFEVCERDSYGGIGGYMRNEDVKTLDVPEQVSDYADQVFQHMYNTEEIHQPTYGYMKNQTDVNEKMRAILIDWLIEVHYKFKLLPETLFITVNLIDRYLERKEIKRQRLQLLGVTAMWIACKYEEIYAPEIKDFVYITDNAYQQKDILALEYELLRTLEFNVTTSTSYRFLQRFTKLSGVSDKTFKLAWYLIELPLIEYKMLKYKPSLISAAALFVA